MMDDATAWQAEIDASRTAFFIDVDGTLLGFKDRPEDVVADTDLLDLLAHLREAAGGAVALVSGRMIADLDRIVAPLVLPAGGVHGAEMRYADGRRELADAGALAEARAEVQAFAHANADLRIEEKGTALAIHYRQAPQLQPEVTRFTAEAASRHGLDVQHGKFVAELKASRGHKGDAIERLMKTVPFAGRRPLFVGDDLTDEHGFGSVNALGGVSIKVGADRGDTTARHMLVDTSDVRRFLASVCR